MNKYKHTTTNPSFLYFRFRESAYYPLVMFGIIIVVCAGLFYFVLLPMVQKLFDVNKEVEQTRKRVVTLQNNLAFLSSINSVDLDKQVVLADKAYPQIKDFAGVIQAVDVAAAESTIVVDDFTFQVGDVSRVNKASPKKTAAGVQKTMLDLSVDVHGDMNHIQQFNSVVKTMLPLANVKTVDFEKDKSNIDIIFASDSYPQKTIDLARSTMLISQKTASTLNTIAQWQDAMNQVASRLPNSASGSGNLPPF